MRSQIAWFVAAVMLGVLGGAVASGLDEAAVVARLSAADHEVEEGYFMLGDGATVIAKPGSDLHRWLTAHRGQRVRLIMEGTREDGEPALRPGNGRDSGQISLRRPGQ